MIQQNQSWLSDQFDQNEGVLVTYESEGESIEVTATRGKWFVEQGEREGVSQRIEARAYYIKTSLLVFAGEPHEPKRGDKITDIENGETVVHEVGSPGGLPVWEFVNGRTKRRIRTIA